MLDSRLGAAGGATKMFYSYILPWVAVWNRIQGKMVQFYSSLCSSLHFFQQLLPCSIYEPTNVVYYPSIKYSYVTMVEHTIWRSENTFLVLCRGILLIDMTFIGFLHLQIGTWNYHTWFPSVQKWVWCRQVCAHFLTVNCFNVSLVYPSFWSWSVSVIKLHEVHENSCACCSSLFSRDNNRLKT